MMKCSKYLKRYTLFVSFVFLVTLLGCTCGAASEKDLPVIVPDLTRLPDGIGLHLLHPTFQPAPDGLMLDLGDPGLQGQVYTGQYPFAAGEADYDYTRYVLSSPLSDGKAVLPLKELMKERFNVNKWPDAVSRGTPTAAFRLELLRLKDGVPVSLGCYDGLTAFRREGDKFFKSLSIIEGPFVAQESEGHQAKLLIAWETDLPSTGKVFVYPYGHLKGRTESGDIENSPDEPLAFEDSQFTTQHRVSVSGLKPDTKYYYAVESATPENDHVKSNLYPVRTAPEKGKGSVTFAFSSDSRAGVGDCERNYLGLNMQTLSGIALDAYRRGADLLLFGGDLANGYTSETADCQLQLKAWKQAVSGFWRTRPIYLCMGNHEVLTNSYDDNSVRGLRLDKWPYADNSTEAVFAGQFLNPSNAPSPSDPRRPPYAGTVYKFAYGPVLFIVLNNNYWWTTNGKVHIYGGNPEGYILEDQLVWMEETLADAEADPAVRYVIMLAHEPVFPSVRHVIDSMWWEGNNNVRAFSKKGSALEPEKLGIIEVRNRLWKAVAGSGKVAAVLSSHEHAYHRTLITSKTPVGVYPGDDTNNDGILDVYSPNADFLHPTWQITAGTAGAPYYVKQEKTPWKPEIFLSEEGYAIFQVDDKAISLKFISVTGQILDEIPDLMAVKKNTDEH